MAGWLLVEFNNQVAQGGDGGSGSEGQLFSGHYIEALHAVDIQHFLVMVNR